MASHASQFIAPPPLVFRVGVTGAAGLDKATKDRLRPRIASMLRSVKTELEALAVDERVATVFAPDENGGLRRKLRIVSPLGEGADRLVAVEALRLGYALEVPLPFAQPAYEGTFPSSVAEFRSLLAQAEMRILTLDGDFTDAILRPRSYGAVGRFVVRNCDLLIAIWDDKKPPKGPGGTTDTVRFAVHAGVPVLWLHADGAQEPRLLTDVLNLAQPENALSGDTALNAWLRQHLADTILPPKPPASPQLELLSHIMGRAREWLGAEADPLRVFLDEAKRENPWIWTVHDRLLGPPKRRSETAGQGPPSHPAAYLARFYQARYRSSYLFVFVLAAVALISAVLGLAFEGAEFATTPIELAALLLILMLVLANRVKGWQERYMSYRLLAELFRLQRRLATLGWSLPALEVSGLAVRSGRSWVGWYFASVVRATPLLKDELAAEPLTQTQGRVARDLLDEQIVFHRQRREWKKRSGRALGRWGVALFAVTLGVVAVKSILLLAGLGHGTTPWFGLLAALLPAASAAFFGIRAYEEMELLAEQSDRMLEALIAAKQRIEAIKLDRPLALQLLAGEVYEVAMLMLADVNGWAQLFRMKAIGVG